MTDDATLKAHATRLLLEVASDPEYCVVYEDEELADQEGDWATIYGLMHSATLEAYWPDDEVEDVPTYTAEQISAAFDDMHFTSEDWGYEGFFKILESKRVAE